ncbi:MAG: TetR/AcrR family transcriptional regulator [Deltaproteobacteria bacterium]|nr:TetR/AcrR family transcriptional regulator [Deltaproteobacteria bacterium]
MTVHSFERVNMAQQAGGGAGGGEVGEKRERILEAAEEVFARRGFHGARVTDIARLAGVADGTIYLYFKSKDDLLVSLFEDRVERINNMLRIILASEQRAQARLEKFINYYLGLAVKNPNLAEVIAIELRSSSKFMKEYKNVKFIEFLGLLAQIIKDGQTAGEIREDLTPEVISRTLFGALDELLLGYLLSRRRYYEATSASEQVFNVFWTGLENRGGRR